MALPKVDTTDVIQVVMTGAFYNAHFKPLLEQQDFDLMYGPSTEEEDDAGLATYIIGLGESRAGLMKPRTGHVLPESERTLSDAIPYWNDWITPP